jgi:hypothetical protein
MGGRGLSRQKQTRIRGHEHDIGGYLMSNHQSMGEHSSLLPWRAVSTAKYCPVFWKMKLLPSSGCKSPRIINTVVKISKPVYYM